MENKSILISRSKFKQAIKTLSVSSKGKYPPEMIFFCQGETLLIRLGGSGIQINGKGSFDGQARLSGKALKPLSLVLPDDDPLPITRHPERLGIGNLLLSCKWGPHSSKIIPVAINADDLDYLRISKTHSFDEISKAGLVSKIEAATNTLNGQVMKAYELLKSYGIEYDDLHKLIDDAILDEGTNELETG